MHALWSADLKILSRRMYMLKTSTRLVPLSISHKRSLSECGGRSAVLLSQPVYVEVEEPGPRQNSSWNDDEGYLPQRSYSAITILILPFYTSSSPCVERPRTVTLGGSVK
ncbi:hypothetical protein PoB_007673300 [Plakobranchus ocellatus]|uniref:Uncharacterized protein n=1 Tax=Plakobranchus ocellatus TaxID=259542 RepID=A0AAV4E1L5_9GAST|nr:hypothetical protein PoB_007673300 [Plakobranchus ocellatus]